MLVVAVISADVYLFGFLRPDIEEDTGIGVFW